ncbi:FAD-dependent oxidoreductase [Pelolinea submarina]|uniref:FAD dependent oxidoreductase n=1 Tax=Pelolinea submarina TaxID=913107 RepID=A0A347ZR25_9CHLR|nr:FAD-dependent oxidoreductase [Pelolinea submarina]REG11690.1 FAD dependent oxidoreductase [Pelolinea submarina]BBB47756.1 heterodisulfide reductase subunit A [Pelolinea submarina]
MSDSPNQEELRIGVYICHCGSNIAGVIPPAEVAEWASHLPGVVRATDTLYACADSGQSLIKEDIKKYNLNRVVVSACSVRMHETTFRGAVSEAGLNPFLMEMANIREQCTWAHGHDKAGALEKAKDLTAAAVAKARFLTPLEFITVPVTKRAMVIGGGVAGISAALDLADQGIETVLVEKEPTIGGVMAQLNKTFPTMDCSI